MTAKCAFEHVRERAAKVIAHHQARSGSRMQAYRDAARKIGCGAKWLGNLIRGSRVRIDFHAGRNIETLASQLGD